MRLELAHKCRGKVPTCMSSFSEKPIFGKLVQSEKTVRNRWIETNRSIMPDEMLSLPMYSVTLPSHRGVDSRLSPVP